MSPAVRVRDAALRRLHELPTYLWPATGLYCSDPVWGH